MTYFGVNKGISILWAIRQISDRVFLREILNELQFALFGPAIAVSRIFY